MKDRIRVIGICAALVAVGYFVPAVMNMLFNAFDMALGWAGSLVVVTVISGLVGILFLLAFPHVSSQAGIVAVKDRIKFNLLAIRLFPDDLKNVLFYGENSDMELRLHRLKLVADGGTIRAIYDCVVSAK
ncbi:MAG TPA: hypothetical protein EYN86_02135 [Planctomycetes bacterium]|nr:hypothetical protein [Planctomycetota bacterium]